MADNGGAQKGIGGLFVDLGLKGLGSMLKGLNSISASFLLTKNSAQQAIKPLLDMSKQASNNTLALDKWNSITGLSIDNLQFLQRLAKANGLEFNSLVGQIGQLQQKMVGLKLGKDSSLVSALSSVGITDMSVFDTSAPDKFFMSIIKLAGRSREEVGTFILSLFGLDSSLMYLAKHGVNAFDEIYDKTEAEKETLDEQGDLLRELEFGFNSLKDKVIASIPGITEGLEFIINLQKMMIADISSTNGEWAKFIKHVEKTSKPLRDVLNLITKISSALKSNPLLNKIFDTYYKAQEEHPYLTAIPATTPAAMLATVFDSKLKNTTKYTVPINDTATAEAYLKQYPGADIRKDWSGGNYVITVHQNITGADSQDIANKSVSGIQKELNEVRNNNGVNR